MLKALANDRLVKSVSHTLVRKPLILLQQGCACILLSPGSASHVRDVSKALLLLRTAAEVK